MAFPIALPQLGLRRTASRAAAEGGRNGFGARARLEHITNRPLPSTPDGGVARMKRFIVGTLRNLRTIFGGVRNTKAAPSHTTTSTPMHRGTDRTAPVTAQRANNDARAVVEDRAAHRAAEQVRSGNWNGPLGDLTPYIAPQVPGWPQGRQLEIHDPKGPLTFNGPAGPGKSPVLVYLDGQHYSPILNGEPGHVPSSGNCFFESVIHAMGPEDASAFGSDREAQWKGLRDAVADYLILHWGELRLFL